VAVPADAATPIVLRAKSLEKTGDDKRWSAKRKTVHAVQGVSLEIRREQTIGIDGESGSGKSTVARCIVRLVDANGGSVRLGSEDITMMSHGVLHALRKRVQIVFLDSYPLLSG
jgi:ABC-type oligopeptide transport system ATPase subunit